MKNFFKICAITLTIISGFGIQTIHGQSIELFFGDLLNGAVNGAALGAATMALQDTEDFAPLRVGVGSGILYGAGVAVYDYSILPKGQPFYISGTFNSGNNSTIIVLLDTFYGAAVGATLGTAISLISNDSILEGLQYGSGAGAWIGFGFGLIDAFILAEKPNDFVADANFPVSNRVNGVFQYASDDETVNIGFIHPTIMAQPVMKAKAIQTRYSFGVEMLNVNIEL